MKCQFCGYNLGIEEEFCPHCGKENSQAARHVADMKQFKDDYEKTKDTVIKKSRKFNERTSRALILVIMLLIVAGIMLLTRYLADFESNQVRNEKKRAQEVEKNLDSMKATLKEMEEHREYLAMEYYVLNHRLNSNENFRDYSRVFNAVIEYEVIYTDILGIVDGNDYYGERTKEDWCKDIAIYIDDWNAHVAGEFWNDSPDSPMHAPEHEAFMNDCKKEIQDMVQVYFELTDEQAEAMWTMGEEEVGRMLYDKCVDLYPEENANE